MTIRCKLKNRQSHKTATGEPVQDEGSRVLPIATEEGLHRCVKFRMAPVQKALVSAPKVCHESHRIILDSEPGQSGMLHKHADEWIGLRDGGWISGRKRSRVLSLRLHVLVMFYGIGDDGSGIPLRT